MLPEANIRDLIGLAIAVDHPQGSFEVERIASSTTRSMRIHVPAL
jgi:hypothetical protein